MASAASSSASLARALPTVNTFEAEVLRMVFCGVVLVVSCVVLVVCVCV